MAGSERQSEDESQDCYCDCQDYSNSCLRIRRCQSCRHSNAFGFRCFETAHGNSGSFHTFYNNANSSACINMRRYLSLLTRTRHSFKHIVSLFGRTDDRFKDPASEARTQLYRLLPKIQNPNSKGPIFLKRKQSEDESQEGYCDSQD